MREKLADRLRVLYSEATEDVFGVLADEVLRQMAWAWHTQGGSAVHGGKWIETRTITLAPEDWKP